MRHNPYIGSELDDLLQEDGILDEINFVALKRVLAWQILQEMEKRGLNKIQMASAMETSRSSLDRLLTPDNLSVTLKTMARAAKVLGKQLRLELVDPPGFKDEFQGSESSTSAPQHFPQEVSHNQR